MIIKNIAVLPVEALYILVPRDHRAHSVVQGELPLALDTTHLVRLTGEFLLLNDLMVAKPAAYPVQNCGSPFYPETADPYLSLFHG